MLYCKPSNKWRSPLKPLEKTYIPKKTNCTSLHIFHTTSILRPASVVRIGNRLKNGHCFMMFRMPNVLPTQF